MCSHHSTSSPLLPISCPRRSLLCRNSHSPTSIPRNRSSYLHWSVPHICLLLHLPMSPHLLWIPSGTRLCMKHHLTNDTRLSHEVSHGYSCPCIHLRWESSLSHIHVSQSWRTILSYIYTYPDSDFVMWSKFRSRVPCCFSNFLHTFRLFCSSTSHPLAWLHFRNLRCSTNLHTSSCPVHEAYRWWNLQCTLTRSKTSCSLFPFYAPN